MLYNSSQLLCLVRYKGKEHQFLLEAGIGEYKASNNLARPNTKKIKSPSVLQAGVDGYENEQFCGISVITYNAVFKYEDSLVLKDLPERIFWV